MADSTSIDNIPEMPLAPATGQTLAEYVTTPDSSWSSNQTQSSTGPTYLISTWGTNYASGTFNIQGSPGESVQKNNISAHLCFKYIKSKMNIIETSKFKARMERLEKMVNEFTEIGQVAMAEQSLKLFMQFTKESAMYACGYRYWITREHAEKFRYSLKGTQSLKITPLENFGRVIPKKAIEKLKFCNTKKLFDSYVIFHLDAKGAVVETEKQKKERERDPILFGMIDECPDRYYFIVDWIDELDDLKFSDILEALSLEKKNIQIEPSVSMEDVKKAINGDKKLKKKLT